MNIQPLHQVFLSFNRNLKLSNLLSKLIEVLGNEMEKQFYPAFLLVLLLRIVNHVIFHCFSGNTVFHTALMNKDYEIFTLLMDQEFNIDQQKPIRFQVDKAIHWIEGGSLYKD